MATMVKVPRRTIPHAGRVIASLALLLLSPTITRAAGKASAEVDLSASEDTAVAEASAPAPPPGAATEQKIRPMPIIDTGPQAGFRTGFAIGSGKTIGPNFDISEVVTGYLPLWLDVGYRILPSLFIGAYGQMGFVFLKQADNCKGSDASCTGQDYRLGAELIYHFNDDGRYDPWVGLGAGYEWLKLNVSFADTYRGSFNETLRGFELVNVQLGLDIRPTRQGGIGPFVAVALAQYNHIRFAHVTPQKVDADADDISAPQAHRWIIFGIQGSYFDDL
jgi:opacity protein-like surface antigen